MDLVFVVILVFVLILLISPPSYFVEGPSVPRYIASGLPIAFDEPIDYGDNELYMDRGTLRVRDLITPQRKRGSSIRMCRGTVVSVIDDELADQCTFRRRTPDIFNEYTMGFSLRDDAGTQLD